MTAQLEDRETELPVVGAMRLLSVFGAEQAGAYREYFSELAHVLGDDIETKLGSYIASWAKSGEPGVLVLTGNAGTGKTAVAEGYCRTLGAVLPEADELLEIAPRRFIVKDLSGFPDLAARTTTLRFALEAGDAAQVLLCANEGVLRDSIQELEDHTLSSVLESALRDGASRTDRATIVNVNRQRPTSSNLWSQLLNYITRETLWTGCSDCPFDTGGCPMRTNAERLRDPVVREQLRTLVRLGAGEAVPTMREVLAILAWAIVGNDTCKYVKEQNRDLGIAAFTATSGYFTRLLGGGLSEETVSRSPLLASIRRSGLGNVSDLEVDGWLRDTTGAPSAVRELAGAFQAYDAAPVMAAPGLVGSRSHLDRIRTKQGPMTFHALGEMVSTDEDPVRVEDGLDALVHGDRATSAPAQSLWRQRAYFELVTDIGGHAVAARRLLDYRYLPDLLDLAQKVAARGDTVIELTELVRGLNFLVTGFASPNEGLIVPEPACLFARDPGSFRPAQPSLVHTQVSLGRLGLTVPDRGLVEDILDVDHIDVHLVVDADSAHSLRIRPQLYEAIREAAEFQGPVGQGVAEMSDLRSFYGRLATNTSADDALRVADPESYPPALVNVRLPYLLGEESGYEPGY